MPRTASARSPGSIGQAGGIRELLRLAARIRKELIKHYDSPVRRRDRAHQIQGHRRRARGSSAACSTPRGSIARASTCMAARRPSSGRSSSTNRWSCTRAKLPEPKIPKPVKTPDFAKRLPKAIQPFTTKGVYDASARRRHLSFTQGAGHGGSHPHLAHEFVMRAGREPRPVPERRSSPPTGPASASAPTSPRSPAGRS